MTDTPDGHDEPDFLDEMIAEGARENPEFPRLVEEGTRRLELLHALAVERRARGFSQTRVAARMGSSQSSLARLEGAASDAKLSTVQRFASALGMDVQFHLIPAEEAADRPSVVVHAKGPDRQRLAGDPRNQARVTSRAPSGAL